MNKKNFVVLISLLNTLLDLGEDIDQLLSKQKKDKIINLFENNYSKLMNDKNFKEELLKELEKYLKMVK